MPRARGARAWSVDAVTVTRDRFIAVVGAAVIAAMVAGLVVVEERTGPFDHAVTPARVDAEAAGSFTTAGPRDTGPFAGACGTPAAGSFCEGPRTEVSLLLMGLPRVGAEARYVGFLVGPDRELPLGALTREADTLALEWAGDVDGRAFTALVVTLHAGDGAAAPSPFVAFEHALPGSGGTVDLTGAFDVTLAPAAGTLRVAQIGAVEVSATAEARLTRLPFAPGWAYHAWFVDATGARTSLGAVEEGADGAGVVDARVERVDLDAQERFLVTLAPAAASTPSPGFPVVDVPLAT